MAAGAEAYPGTVSLPVTAIAEQRPVTEEIILVVAMMNPREEGIARDPRPIINTMTAAEETIAGKKKTIVAVKKKMMIVTSEEVEAAVNEEVEATVNVVEAAGDREISSQMLIVIVIMMKNLPTLPRSRLNRKSKSDEHQVSP